MQGWNDTLKIWNDIVENISPETYMNSIQFIDIILLYAYADYDCAMSLINGIDSILRNPSVGPDNYAREGREEMFRVLNSFTNHIANILKPGFKSHVGNGGIIIETAKFPGMHRFFRNVAAANDVPQMSIDLQPYMTNFITLNQTAIGVDISIEALFMSMEKTVGKDPQLKITAYSAEVFQGQSETSTESRSTRSCLTALNAAESEQCANDNSETNETLKSWGLLTIELDGLIQNLSEPIEFVLTNNRLLEGETMKCVFWNESGTRILVH